MDDEIVCEIQTEPLLLALRSASSSSNIVMKLSKRNNAAVFCFEMQMQVRPFLPCRVILSQFSSPKTREGKKMEITHDVRVRILRKPEVLAIKEPLCPEPDAS